MRLMTGHWAGLKIRTDLFDNLSGTGDGQSLTKYIVMAGWKCFPPAFFSQPFKIHESEKFTNSAFYPFYPFVPDGSTPGEKPGAGDSGF